MIADTRGRPVWFKPAGYGQTVTDLRVQTYLGQRVLTYWQGNVALGHGTGSYTILDRHYRVIRRIRAGNGLQGDLHEFHLTNRGTALLTSYVPVEDPKVYDGVVQEIDLTTGQVVFEWHSLQHVPLTESLTGANFGYADYFHVNAADLTPDGNFLISGRNTSTIYKVNRETGEIMWRLGGKNSDFTLGPGVEFNFQHDAAQGPNGTITLFDNGGAPQVEPRSRGLVVALDETAHTATLQHEYTVGDVYGAYEGNLQLLSNGNVFMGFGTPGVFSELSSEGQVLFSAQLPEPADTYRAYHSVWHGTPMGRPSVSATRRSGVITASAEWNGATEVRTWRVLTGSMRSKLTVAGAGPWSGLNTRLRLRPSGRYLAVQARDGRGRVLGTSKTVRVR